MADQLERKLEDVQWLNGQSPSSADAEAFNAFVSPPDVTTHPHTFSWYNLVSFFNPDYRNNWPASPPDAELQEIVKKLASMPKPVVVKQTAKK